VERIVAELAEVRLSGLAYNRGESVPDVYAVAAGVVGGNGALVAAVSVAGPLDRVSRAREGIAVHLLEATARITKAHQAG
jgi:DNA-binding IclR family transcriptional regulator